MHTPRTRTGFTLTELLVVIAIIAILIALLVPAVQRVREAANVAQCGNQLKQIGLAFHNHHDTFGVFPSGGTTASDARVMSNTTPADYTVQSWGWAYQILPYIEQGNLWASPSDMVVASTPVATYICPSFRGPRIWPYVGAPGERAMIDYTANAGTVTGSYDGAVVPSRSEGPRRNRRLGDIIDGTSNTLLVAEKYVGGAVAWTKPSCNDDKGYVDGWGTNTICYARFRVGPLYPNDYDGAETIEIPKQINASDKVTCAYLFGSIHVSMLAVFCDGSVHGVPYDINTLVWGRLCSIDDGEPTGFED